MMKERESNIELLRILATLGVITLHINLKILPMIPFNSVQSKILYIGESLTIGSVNVFLLISGFFLGKANKRSLWKPIEMIIELIIIKISFYAVSCILGTQAFCIQNFLFALIPNNYYVIFYVVLYVISLYMNEATRYLSEREFRSLIIILIFLFSIWPSMVDVAGDLLGKSIDNLSSVTREGSAYGYNIVHFSVMYLIGSYFRNSPVSKKTLFLYALIFFMIAVVYFLARFAHRGTGFRLGTEFSYCNPVIVFLSISIFLLFTKLKIKNNRAINRMAKASYTVYLTHPWFLRRFPLERIAHFSPIMMVVALTAVVISVFLVCWVLHELWNWSTKKAFYCLEKRSLFLLIEDKNGCK